MEIDYQILGIDPGASIAEVKEQYYRLIRQHHPDRGGNNEYCAKLTDSYKKILESLNKSTINTESYNKPSMNGMMQHQNLFRDFFSGNNNWGGPSIEYHQVKVDLSLSEFYSGTNKTMMINTSAGPMQFNVAIPAGSSHGQLISMVVKNHHITVVLNEIGVSLFKRNHYDLYYDHELTLTDALSDGVIDIYHPNGNLLHIDRPKLTSCQQTIELKGKGMPIAQTDQFGKLVIRFNILLPISVPAEFFDIAEQFIY